MKSERQTANGKRQTGFTLIEILVALAFVSIAMVSLLAVIRSDLRLVRTASASASAAQAAMIPESAMKKFGMESREISSEDVELGPIRVQRVVTEFRRRDEKDGIRLTLYR